MATHAFLDRTDVIEQSYRITREDQILRPYVGNPESPTLRDAVAIARRGAFGDLTPMRHLLKTAITADVLLAVAAESAAGRGLFVGVVDVDTGQALAFSLSELAEQFRDQPGRRELIRECYLDAIVASSSVPLAAPPTFIDNRMYIDGGARFGVFSDELSAVAAELSSSGPTDGNPTGTTPTSNIFIIINGDLRAETLCGKVDQSLCHSAEVRDGSAGAHKPWKITSLAKRSVEILVDQVYRFSNAKIMQRAQVGNFAPHLLRIHADLKTFRTGIPHPGGNLDELTCPEWRLKDKQLERPIEFHPRYMHCLVNYGSHKARQAGWATLE